MVCWDTSLYLLFNLGSEDGMTSKFRVRHWQLYLIFAVPMIVMLIFRYYPMFGLQIAFRDFSPTKGMWGSPWAGLKHFERFFLLRDFKQILSNTLILNLYSILVLFPMGLVLAIAINEARGKFLRKSAQLISFLPYFLSIVVMVSMLNQVTDLRVGLINNIIELFGGTRVNFSGSAEWFRHLFVWSRVWQITGYGSIIYIAALSSVDPNLVEAARIDGANKLQKIWYVDIPCIRSTILILLILNLGQIMNLDFERVFLMQNSINLGTSEIIATYVYRMGIRNANYSFAAAVGLFNSMVSLIIVLLANKIVGKVSKGSRLF